jgi:hypothetical protein
MIKVCYENPSGSEALYGEGLLNPRPTPKLEGHRLLSVHDCVFNIFAANLHSWRPFLHPQPVDVLCCGESSCEFGIEPSGSMKCWETIEWSSI